MSNNFDKELRAEIIETQKARSDLLKWKLLLIATIGCVGLGLTKDNRVPYAPFILCCIPFVCYYVDILCAHLNLRINAIGRYFVLKNKNVNIDYEDLCERLDKEVNYFGLETYALRVTTILLSIFVVILGVCYFFIGGTIYPSIKKSLIEYQNVCLAITIGFSGLLGIFSTFYVRILANKKMRSLDKIIEELLTPKKN